MYVSAAALAFAVAAGVGAISALMLRGDIGAPAEEEPRALDEQEKAARPQENDAAAEQEEEETVPKPEQEAAAAEQNGTEYAREVGAIQSDVVETFLQSHNKLLRYDALTADDIEQMQANEAALQGFADQAADLDPPRKYGEHHEVFGSAINELHEAAQLAYDLAADPIAATQSGFDEYDRHVTEASALLQRSNESLGEEYKTIQGVQKVNPLS